MTRDAMGGWAKNGPGPFFMRTTTTGRLWRWDMEIAADFLGEELVDVAVTRDR